jgi:molecular chaperone DnaK
MAKIIGIDLGTTYSAVSIWDEQRQMPIIIPNLLGAAITPSVVSVNHNGHVIVGEDARRNLWAAPEDTVSQIKREMGNDYWVSMKGQKYSPQTISAFILKYLKMCAERYLGEPVHDAVITVPAYFTDVQRAATRDAGLIAGLNVHRLIDDTTAFAIAWQVDYAAQHPAIYAVYGLGGGALSVSIVQITPDSVSIIENGGDLRLGGLDMDEALVHWSVQEIKARYGVDLTGNETAMHRLMLEAEQAKKALSTVQVYALHLPYLALLDREPLNVRLEVTRELFERLIDTLLMRSIECLDATLNRAEQRAGFGSCEALAAVLLAGGPTVTPRVREVLRDYLRARCPHREIAIRPNLNPEAVVAEGCAVVARGLAPIGRPPGEADETGAERDGAAEPGLNPLGLNLVDVAGHSVGVSVGHRFHTLIAKGSALPVSAAFGPVTNATDFATEILLEVFEGEEEFVQANIKIGEVRISGLEPLPTGHQQFEFKFCFDVSGLLSALCTDRRTRKAYTGCFVLDGITRMNVDEIKKQRQAVAQLMKTP